MFRIIGGFKKFSEERDFLNSSSWGLSIDLAFISSIKPLWIPENPHFLGVFLQASPSMTAAWTLDERKAERRISFIKQRSQGYIVDILVALKAPMLEKIVKKLQFGAQKHGVLHFNMLKLQFEVNTVKHGIYVDFKKY